MNEKTNNLSQYLHSKTYCWANKSTSERENVAAKKKIRQGGVNESTIIWLYKCDTRWWPRDIKISHFLQQTPLWSKRCAHFLHCLHFFRATVVSSLKSAVQLKTSILATSNSQCEYITSGLCHLMCEELAISEALLVLQIGVSRWMCQRNANLAVSQSDEKVVLKFAHSNFGS